MLFRSLAATLVWTVCSVPLSGEAARAEDEKKPEKKSEAGVVIDFSNWSVCYNVEDVSLQVEFEGVAVGKPVRYEGGNGVMPAEFAQMYYELLKTWGAKVEHFDKTKVCIIGWEDKKGVFHPAIKWTVTSKTLKPEQLPKVTNPSKKG